MPTVPAYLDGAAKVEYLALANILDASGKLSQTDPKLIELYAINYDLLVRAYVESKSQPLLTPSGSRATPLHPVHREPDHRTRWSS